ncbi:MAG TPA: hypothetical protein VM934_00775 [Pyrinomonadaceae bacterium]|jgi:CYTH domain-containing protein|nr:hypothetical protein [Pyrinomonadaceae bacterium]
MRAKGIFAKTYGAGTEALERRFLLRELPLGLSLGDTHFQVTENYVTGTPVCLVKLRLPETREVSWHLEKREPDERPRSARVVYQNIDLDEYEYEALSVFEANELRYNRYPFDYEGWKYAVDVYLGPLWGLILAWTSFTSEEESESFELPTFAVLEVTRDEMFAASKLVELSADDIRRELARRADK